MTAEKLVAQILAQTETFTPTASINVGLTVSPERLAWTLDVMHACGELEALSVDGLRLWRAVRRGEA